MLILAILLILAGAVVAVTLERTIGMILAVIGIILLLYVLLVTADAEAAQVVWSSWSLRA